MAELSTLTIALEPDLLKEIDRLAAYETKGRMGVVREAIVRHIEEMTEMADLKQLASEKYLNEQLSFDQLARIVGYAYALEIQIGKSILEESIAGAKKDSSSQSDS
ncbi:MAG: hypothetical protein O7E52_15690 [Candidatus Poribacteria bacterium]|nr:hypothetical protein [Candidatus Poribacteria bacterium]